eukprot:TRINITY_DN71504_c0_g1_i1.p2 TRINITY_DN71504_c0_g1~~TRINITY_DN71504_c0_g1_i1.p2  ORF type:complete len:139 (+),score=38.81 TRINITY_DN71504_c0_g1_i1:80-496(+)
MLRAVLLLCSAAVALASSNSTNGTCADPPHGCAACRALAPNETCVSTTNHTGVPQASPQKCVLATADPVLIGKALEYACGIAGTKVRCQEINAGGCCFMPDTAESHAAWAMQQYYATEWRTSGDFACSFNGAGKLVPW